MQQREVFEPALWVIGVAKGINFSRHGALEEDPCEGVMADTSCGIPPVVCTRRKQTPPRNTIMPVSDTTQLMWHSLPAGELQTHLGSRYLLFLFYLSILSYPILSIYPIQSYLSI